ncbi:9481_t:CDS:2 [Diversispora eburnea]|uniref:9481_t:CDS:1 n=1 Tax=Diversispora eburnea TaxID=1213867 RepID=A0A9N8UY51_9GLOM|nr:9481_t:CDS:2 [Diversispora eburnea]
MTPNKNKRSGIPFTWKSFVAFVCAGIGLYFYFNYEKQKLIAKRKEELASKTFGKPNIGGPFELVNQDGQTVSDKSFLGKFLLVYFGFTHCPDICPVELNKMAKVTDKINNDSKYGNILTPIFISCDPNRDTYEVIKKYISGYHKDMIGLTGTYEQIAKAAKAYRVYFSRPPDIKSNEEEYLVDHSIFFYLMDPNGEFIDCYGSNTTIEEVSNSVKDYIKNFLSKKGNRDVGILK